MKKYIFLGLAFILISCRHNDQVVLETNFGDIVIEVNYDVAPNHSENFVKLVKSGFYDGTTFHRLVPGGLIQGGDPLSKDDDPDNDGLGGPGYTIDHEFGLKNVRGAVGAGRVKTFDKTEKKSNGSQFYICLQELRMMDGAYTIFGTVIKNLEVADKISWEPVDFNNKPKNPIIIKHAYVVE
ncbi:MAG: peptidylprolyl isomerase [Calditrichae bacterium]|nr:peptidylprolyl isomerase [Calditrichota bacterium]MCB9058838.1 peptidylprolyl isomerase [Calditrichia bacterium]